MPAVRAFPESARRSAGRATAALRPAAALALESARPSDRLPVPAPVSCAPGSAPPSGLPAVRQPEAELAASFPGSARPTGPALVAPAVQTAEPCAPGWAPPSDLAQHPVTAARVPAAGQLVPSRRGCCSAGSLCLRQARRRLPPELAARPEAPDRRQLSCVPGWEHPSDPARAEQLAGRVVACVLGWAHPSDRQLAPSVVRAPA